ncbi:GtrA family protein [Yinghuangia sp. YIM S09857]|uniref:GtrA family protein n=1 Tax=Yinghuangia sp. YIM S09857 TaxID=3436929 RepID=UPI003F53992E
MQNPTAVQNLRLRRLTAHPMFPELAKFAVVGGSAYLTDLIFFNLLRTQTGYGPLTAKALSLVASIVVGFVGNRYWTYRERAGDGGAREVTRQGLAFVAVTQVGNLIQMAFLAFSHYVLGLTSLLADNVFGNVIGMGVATVFRFWGYRTWVFRADKVGETCVGTGVEAGGDSAVEVGGEAVPATAPAVPSSAISVTVPSPGGPVDSVGPVGDEILEASGRR